MRNNQNHRNRNKISSWAIEVNEDFWKDEDLDRVRSDQNLEDWNEKERDYRNPRSSMLKDK